MSRVFPKLAKAITLAAKDGGSDPESNAKLRAAIRARRKLHITYTDLQGVETDRTIRPLAATAMRHRTADTTCLTAGSDDGQRA